MFRKKILYVAQLSTVGLAGYYLGQNQGNNANTSEDSIIINGKTVRNMPGLPLFGTVSAATPYADSGSSKDRVSQIMKYGFPSLDNVRSYDDFVLSYDRRNRVPHWVFEHLTKMHVAKNDQVDRSKCDFKPDESIHPFFRSQNSDYKGSGFDRGHMAAAGNHRIAQQHVDQTFYLTNMAPQVGDGFNRHAWNRLEKHVRNLTKVYNNVYCCTGPLYLPRPELRLHKLHLRTPTNHACPRCILPTSELGSECHRPLIGSRVTGARSYCPAIANPPAKLGTAVYRRESDGKSYVKYQVIGANTVSVPTHFYKVVVAEAADGSLDMEAYVMPNQRIPDETPVSSFMVPPETIERAAGLLFFDRIQRSKLNKINGKKV